MRSVFTVVNPTPTSITMASGENLKAESLGEISVVIDGQKVCMTDVLSHALPNFLLTFRRGFGSAIPYKHQSSTWVKVVEIDPILKPLTWIQNQKVTLLQN